MKSVLIITYYWPPASGPGVQRWLKFSKYLLEFGWTPVILTVENGSYVNTDKELLKDIPKELKIYQTKTLEPFLIYNALRGKKGKAIEVGMGNIKGKPSFFKRLSTYIRSNFFVPDARIGWNRFAFPKALKLIEKENIELVITTGPPHSTHLIGRNIKNKVNLPWIADFRDPWTSIYYENYLTRSKKSSLKNKTLEQDTIENSDVLLVVSKGMKEEFGSENPKIHCLPNGYDEDDLPEKIHQASDVFNLAYIGNLKSNQNIVTLWEAVSELDSEIENFKFCLSFTGNVHEDIKTEIKKRTLEHLVVYKPFVKHSEAFRLMSEATLLYLPIPKSENNKLILTGKIFEYIASSSPILSLGPIDGNAAEILKTCEREQMIDYDNKTAIKKVIKTLYLEWQQSEGMSFKHTSESYKQFSRKQLSRDLAQIMDHLITQ